MQTIGFKSTFVSRLSASSPMLFLQPRNQPIIAGLKFNILPQYAYVLHALMWNDWMNAFMEETGQLIIGCE